MLGTPTYTAILDGKMLRGDQAVRFALGTTLYQIALGDSTRFPYEYDTQKEDLVINTNRFNRIKDNLEKSGLSAETCKTIQKMLFSYVITID